MHGLLAVGVVLIAVIVWYGASRQNAGPQSVLSPGTTPAVRRLTASERQAAAEALQALRALQSITRAGITLADYAPRVLDTKIQIDRFLQAQGGDVELKQQIGDAMALYVIASAAWRARVSGGYAGREPFEMVGRDPALELCPEMGPIVSTPPPGGTSRTPNEDRGIKAGFNFEIFWSCASRKLEMADDVLKRLSG